MKRKDIYTLLFGVLCCAGTSLCFSCADDLEIGKQFDESALEGIYENRVFLCDASSNKVNILLNYILLISIQLKFECLYRRILQLKLQLR